MTTDVRRLEPNREQIKSFVDAIFRHASPKSFVSMRAFLEEEDEVFRISPAPLSGGLDFLVDVAEDDARRAAQSPKPAVFCPPLATFASKDGAAEQDIVDGLALSVECDEHPQEARGKLESLLGPATVVVKSGGRWTNGNAEPADKLHLHWRLTQSAKGGGVAKLKRARDIATRIVGGDVTNVPVNHPIRWPGSWHRKKEPRLCEIESLNCDQEIDLDVALQALSDAAGAALAEEADAARPPSGQVEAAAPDTVVAALAAIPNDNLPWDKWNNIGMATWAATRGSDSGFDAFDCWSRKSVKYDARRTASRWRHYFKSPPTRMGGGTIFQIARPAGPIVSDTDHVERAGTMRDMRRPHLFDYRDTFFDFEAGAYCIIDDAVINTDAWIFLHKASVERVIGRGNVAVRQLVPFKPDRNSVGETLAALKAVAHLDPRIEAPCWLDGREGPPAHELISFPNGMLDPRTGELHPVDQALFTTNALGFDYRAEALEPTAWLNFLDEIFNSEREQIDALQEVFGYLITTDNSQEKAFLLLGPKRSGKGTMLAMLRALLAPRAVAGPSLKSLAGNFGLMQLIGKQLAIIDDLRVGTPADQGVLIENVLKITGRGFFSVDRKYKAHWEGLLPVKLMLVSNVMPKLGDDSAAIASRFMIFNTRQTFFGREDPRLFDEKLAPERLGVLHWALAGLRRLRERGYFAEPKASEQAREQLARLGSPVLAFISEYCLYDPDAHIGKAELYHAWRIYAAEQDEIPGTDAKFAAALYAATGGRVKSGRPVGTDGRQRPAFMGIRFRDAPPSVAQQGEMVI
jgi:P4 family phage/plasmid primase-like protien